MNRPSSTGFFLFRLVNDRLDPAECRTMEIINDNARGHIQLGDERKVSNEKLDKAQLHIASRWGDTPAVTRHGLVKDAQLRPIPRRSEFESNKDTRVRNACRKDRRSTCETRTVRRIDRPDKDSVSKAGSKGIHSSSLWRNTTLPFSELPFSENNLHAYHGPVEVGCKNSRVVQFTVSAVLISSPSPQLPIRT
jgi:hypothetical protein